MNIMIKFNELKETVEFLKTKLNEYDYLELENRINRAVIKNYYSINLKKIWVGFAYWGIDEAAEMLNKKELELKNYKLKQYLILKSKNKSVINDYFNK